MSAASGTNALEAVLCPIGGSRNYSSVLDIWGCRRLEKKKNSFFLVFFRNGATLVCGLCLGLQLGPIRVSGAALFFLLAYNPFKGRDLLVQMTIEERAYTPVLVDIY